jgi:hypothetical protein
MQANIFCPLLKINTYCIPVLYILHCTFSSKRVLNIQYCNFESKLKHFIQYYNCNAGQDYVSNITVLVHVRVLYAVFQFLVKTYFLYPVLHVSIKVSFVCPFFFIFFLF